MAVHSHIRQWAWLCPWVRLGATAGMFMLLGLSVWTALLATCLLACPVLQVWGAIQVKRRQQPRLLAPIPNTRGVSLSWMTPFYARLWGLPETQLLVRGVLLSLAWEVLQSPFYADTFAVSWSTPVYNRLHCTRGDALILLVAFWLVALRWGRAWIWLDKWMPGVAFVVRGVPPATGQPFYDALPDVRPDPHGTVGRHGRAMLALPHGGPLEQHYRGGLVQAPLSGVQVMSEDRYCADIMVQISSVQETLRAVGRALMRNHLRHCATQAIGKGAPEEAEAMYDELLALIYKHVR
jgi:DNA-binding FrmR family transcriptional regulator